MRVLIYHVSRLLAKALFAPFIKVHVWRPESEPRKGVWILASNHISHFDPPILAVAVRRKIDWLSMIELFQEPLVAAWFHGIDAIPVDRARLDRRSVRVALTRLKAGHAIGLFPEGGIRSGARSVLEGAPLRPGVAGLSQMTGAAVIPCVILGSDRCYDARRLWRPGRRIPIWIGFGEPLHSPAEMDRAAARVALETNIAEAMRQLSLDMRRHFRLTEDDLPQTANRRRGAEFPTVPTVPSQGAN